DSRSPGKIDDVDFPGLFFWPPRRLYSDAGVGKSKLARHGDLALWLSTVAQYCGSVLWLSTVALHGGSVLWLHK
ncbi:MAG: hypothetical protein AAF657_36220, partial [Acidobacteriota bacterium]